MHDEPSCPFCREAGSYCTIGAAMHRIAMAQAAERSDSAFGKLPANADYIPRAGQAQIMGHFKQGGVDLNGWFFTTKTGVYGTDYLQRAFITAIGLGESAARRRVSHVRS